MRRALVFLLLMMSVPVLAEGPRLTTVILVRHAEKAGGEAAAKMSDDPPLSDAGSARARELARVLAGTKVDAIYTTQYARTRMTAVPLGKAVNVTPQVFEAGKTYAAAMAARIRNDHQGQTVVVVGHSNTTGNVMKELGVANVPPIAETQFDDLFVVTFAEEGTPSVVSLRYGAVAR